ncbi:MAG: hypothetical protein V4574_12755 [Pseudomonadota bacterium]
MNFDTTHDARTAHPFRQPVLLHSVPLHRRLFATGRTPGDIARAAVREVLG